MDGKNLWNAVDLVTRAGNEIDALETELSKRVTDALRVAGLKLGFKFDEGAPDSINSPGDWVTIAFMLQWGLIEKSRRTKYAGNLSVGVVLWSESGERDPCGKLPRVEIAYVAEDEISPDHYVAGTWLEPDGWGGYFTTTDGKVISSTNLKNVPNGLAWDQKTEWYLAVPLFALESTEHIDSLIIKPVMELLSGTAPEVALKNVDAIEFSIGQDGVLSSFLNPSACG